MPSCFLLDRREAGPAQIANEFQMLSQRSPKLVKYLVQLVRIGSAAGHIAQLSNASFKIGWHHFENT
jgi:hypothetical protein